MGPLISGGTFCFGFQVEICGPADGIFRENEYYVTGRIIRFRVKRLIATLRGDTERADRIGTLSTEMRVLAVSPSLQVSTGSSTADEVGKAASPTMVGLRTR